MNFLNAFGVETTPHLQREVSGERGVCVDRPSEKPVGLAEGQARERVLEVAEQKLGRALIQDY